MESRLVFVSHPVAGVHRIPQAWLDGYSPSGFRLATPDEIRRWYEARGVAAPDPSRGALAEPRQSASWYSV